MDVFDAAGAKFRGEAVHREFTHFVTLAVDENTGVVDVAIDPIDPNTMYAASYQRRRRPFGFPSPPSK